ncbi:hypothetical protein G5V59_16850 [Nocardioides sp. W3-2-3]|uniref:hypothetical protein n=1 Tax=Nocardioides convexus TaxID=2712224 RepID=UPI0024187E26|nr:hypothetical protein [Nocardioides convexus]NHA00993.1 hypothetical protein [Nocardioides convexus]
MVGRPSLLRALAGVVAGLALATAGSTAPAGAAPRPAAAPDDTYDAPLAITIDALSPAVLPRSGPLVISGEVTNTDLETWTGISLYPVFSAGPDCARNKLAHRRSRPRRSSATRPRPTRPRSSAPATPTCATRSSGSSRARPCRTR